MTNQSEEVLQEGAKGKDIDGSQKIKFGATEDVNLKEIQLPNSGSDPIVQDVGTNSPSIELVQDDDEDDKPLPDEQPDWYTRLDEVSRSEVRNLCEVAGLPPSDPEVLSKLQNSFNIDEDEAAEVVELFFEGKLQGPRQRLKSILKGPDDAPPLQKQLSWSDEMGGDLTQKHEMDSWHYMYSRRNSPTECCNIL